MEILTAHTASKMRVGGKLIEMIKECDMFIGEACLRQEDMYTIEQVRTLMIGLVNKVERLP